MDFAKIYMEEDLFPRGITNHIANCYLWSDGETAKKVYREAGFRTVAIKQAGRVVKPFRKDEGK